MNEIALLRRLDGNERIIQLVESEVRGGSKGHLMLVCFALFLGMDEGWLKQVVRSWSAGRWIWPGLYLQSKVNLWTWYGLHITGSRYISFSSEH